MTSGPRAAFAASSAGGGARAVGTTRTRDARPIRVLDGRACDRRATTSRGCSTPPSSGAPTCASSCCAPAGIASCSRSTIRSCWWTTRTVRLERRCARVEGELQVPVALLDSLPHDATLARLVYDPARRVRAAGAGRRAGRRAAHQRSTGGTTRLAFPVDRPEEVVVASRSRAHFRVRFGGFFMGVAAGHAARGGLVRAHARRSRRAAGSAFELEIAPEAPGFRLDPRSARRARDARSSTRARAPGLERSRPRARPARGRCAWSCSIPGTAAATPASRVSGAVEKDLTLALARLLKAEIERRLAARVVLTRDDDRDADGRASAPSAPIARAPTSCCRSTSTGSPSSRGARRHRVLPARDVRLRASSRGGGARRRDRACCRGATSRRATRCESRELAEDVLSRARAARAGPDAPARDPARTAARRQRARAACSSARRSPPGRSRPRRRAARDSPSSRRASPTASKPTRGASDRERALIGSAR